MAKYLNSGKEVKKAKIENYNFDFESDEEEESVTAVNASIFKQKTKALISYKVQPSQST